MKKLLILIGIIITTLTLRAQEPAPPFNSNLKQLSTSSFYIQLPDSVIWQYKGSVFGWARIAKMSDLEGVVRDSLSKYQKLPNISITGNEISANGDSITVALGSWRINGITYNKATSTLFPDIPYSPEGTSRYLTFIGKEDNTVDTLGGVADSIAIYPTVLANQANLGSVLIGSGSIGQPSVPTETILGGAITSLPTVGFNAGTNITPQEFIQNVFYRSQAPTSTLSGGLSLEKRPAGTTNVTLSWGAGRLAATQPLLSIVVGGISQIFTQPAAGASTSGTQIVSVTNNTNTTYTNLVTTVDSKTASSSTSVSWLDRRFYGRSASATPDETIIEAAAGGLSALSNSKAGTFTIVGSGSNFPYFAYPAIYGALTSIKDVNNFEVLSSFNQTTVNVTNTFGLTISYLVYTLNAATASNYQITTQ